MDYIKFCEELCIPKKTVKRYPNDKPWFDLSVRTDFLAKEHAFRSGDASAIKKKPNTMFKRQSNPGGNPG